MATTKAQRIGIWTIAIFMAVGTVGSFAIIALANQNQTNDQTRVNALTAQYGADVAEHDKKLSDLYYPQLSEQMSRVASFDKESVTELVSEDITVGDGEDLTEESSFTAYYIGWNSDGVVFDGSVDGESLKAPIDVVPGGVIEGWTKGVAGMKVGGMRELTIPSELAYGEASRGELIPANSPLKFIVMVIPTPEPVEVPQELIKYYQTGRL